MDFNRNHQLTEFRDRRVRQESSRIINLEEYQLWVNNAKDALATVQQEYERAKAVKNECERTLKGIVEDMETINFELAYLRCVIMMLSADEELQVNSSCELERQTMPDEVTEGRTFEETIDALTLVLEEAELLCAEVDSQQSNA